MSDRHATLRPLSSQGSHTQQLKVAMTDEEENFVDSTEADTEELESVTARPKWLLAGVAALVLGGAAYGVLHAQGLQRARGAQVADLLAKGRDEEKAGHYRQALESLERAEALAATDPGFWRLFAGNLSRPHEEAGGALQQLAQRWIWQQVVQRMERGITDVDETPIKALSAYAGSATGTRKADMLAYIGYGAFLKGCLANGDAADQRPAVFYRQALAADPKNPYAHAFWAHLILCDDGDIEQAQPHFDAALASAKDRELVRNVELYALSNSRNINIISSYLWLKLVNQMHKAGEPLGGYSMDILASDYSSGSMSKKERKELYAAVPPADHVELAHYLLESEGTGKGSLAVKVMLAYSIEATGKKPEALAAWQDVQHSAQQLHDRHYVSATHQALKRLSGLKGHRGKRSRHIRARRSRSSAL